MILKLPLNNYNSGSHEIFLRYELFKNNDKITTNDSSKAIIMKKHTLYITIISVFIKHLFKKARVATADKKYDNYAFVDAIKPMKDWPIKAINQLICSKIGKRLLLQWKLEKQLNGTANYLP
jgi:hypothetical protein